LQDELPELLSERLCGDVRVGFNGVSRMHSHRRQPLDELGSNSRKEAPGSAAVGLVPLKKKLAARRSRVAKSWATVRAIVDLPVPAFP
jgi:hypothetical protein